MSSCSKTAMSAYVIRSPKKYSSDKIFQIGIKYGIQKENIILLNNRYYKFLDSVSSSHGINIKQCDSNSVNYKNHLQPLQLLFFNKKGTLISFHNNCYCGGFPNLEWNQDGILDSIPPRTSITLDSIFTFQRLQQFFTFNELNNNRPNSHYEYSLVVLWTTFMGRQSKKLIELVYDKFKKTQSDNFRIYFVNADCLFVD